MTGGGSAGDEDLQGFAVDKHGPGTTICSEKGSSHVEQT